MCNLDNPALAKRRVQRQLASETQGERIQPVGCGVIGMTRENYIAVVFEQCAGCTAARQDWGAERANLVARRAELNDVHARTACAAQDDVAIVFDRHLAWKAAAGWRLRQAADAEGGVKRSIGIEPFECKLVAGAAHSGDNFAIGLYRDACDPKGIYPIAHRGRDEPTIAETGVRGAVGVEACQEAAVQSVSGGLVYAGDKDFAIWIDQHVIDADTKRRNCGPIRTEGRIQRTIGVIPRQHFFRLKDRKPMVVPAGENLLVPSDDDLLVGLNDNCRFILGTAGGRVLDDARAREGTVQRAGREHLSKFETLETRGTAERGGCPLPATAVSLSARHFLPQ